MNRNLIAVLALLLSSQPTEARTSGCDTWPKLLDHEEAQAATGPARYAKPSDGYKASREVVIDSAVAPPKVGICGDEVPGDWKKQNQKLLKARRATIKAQAERMFVKALADSIAGGGYTPAYYPTYYPGTYATPSPVQSYYQPVIHPQPAVEYHPYQYDFHWSNTSHLGNSYYTVGY